MIFHSVIPYENVFSSAQGENTDKNMYAVSRTVTVHSGVTMEVSVMPDGRRRIERLYSTNPSYYLDERFCVGKFVGDE